MKTELGWCLCLQLQAALEHLGIDYNHGGADAGQSEPADSQHLHQLPPLYLLYLASPVDEQHLLLK